MHQPRSDAGYALADYQGLAQSAIDGPPKAVPRAYIRQVVEEAVDVSDRYVGPITPNQGHNYSGRAIRKKIGDRERQGWLQGGLTTKQLFTTRTHSDRCDHGSQTDPPGSGRHSSNGSYSAKHPPTHPWRSHRISPTRRGGSCVRGAHPVAFQWVVHRNGRCAACRHVTQSVAERWYCHIR